MPSPTGIDSRAHILSEKLASVIADHYIQEAQQGDDELLRLRAEVLQLQAQISRLRERAFTVNVDDFLEKRGNDINVDDFLEKRGNDKAADVVNGGLLEEEAQDELRDQFAELAGGKNVIDISKFLHHSQAHNSDNTSRDVLLQNYSHAAHEVGKHISASSAANEDSEITGNAHGKSSDTGKRGSVLVAHTCLIEFGVFEFIMSETMDQWEPLFGANIAGTLAEMRDLMIDQAIMERIARTCHVDEADLENDNKALRDPKERIFQKLEIVSSVLIVLNAVAIGCKLDVSPDWVGWIVIEIVFNTYFLFEMLAKMHLEGLITYFVGKNWQWNLFDFVIVSSSVLDMLLTLLHEIGGLQVGDSPNTSITRLFRIVKITRITRIVRVLRLKMFKELTLMVQGVMVSLRTVSWALVLLTTFMYILGTFMRQVMDPETMASECEAEFGSKGGMSDKCTKVTLYNDMFGSVFRSMLAMFTCFTDGCSLPNGTPFVWHLWRDHGAVLVLVYVIAFMFISFGVLNLIMAVVVENTISAAAQNASKRLFGDKAESLRKARELHSLLVKAAEGAHNLGRNNSCSSRLGHIMDMGRNTGKSETNAPAPHHLHMHISRKNFNEMLKDPAMEELLEDMNISYMSRSRLFDILDIDESGELSIPEVVDGIMRLRGPADKADVVAMSLFMRHMQGTMIKMEDHLRGTRRRSNT